MSDKTRLTDQEVDAFLASVPASDPERLSRVRAKFNRQAILSRKVRNQRKHLRQLNRHVKVLQLQLSHQWHEHRDATNRHTEERKRWATTDYRSVCQCWSCRFREWWRFRSGETYPGKKGWRFPWAKKWGGVK